MSIDCCMGDEVLAGRGRPHSPDDVSSLRFPGKRGLDAMRTGLISLFSGVAIVAAASATAAPVTLVADGHARAVIVVPDAKPSRAVADLRDYIEKSTGARLEVIEERNLGG